METIAKQLESNRAILDQGRLDDQGVQEQKQWAQNVQGYMRGRPKPESMSEAGPILIGRGVSI